MQRPPVAERAGLVGKVLDGRYEIRARLALGGTAVVFQGTDRVEGGEIVVKTMRPQFVHNVDLVRRLRREAEVARDVRHPGIVPVLHEGVLEDGSPYLVMPHLRGESVARLLRRHGFLDVGETSAIALRVADILHAAHRRGYVHRDVKPEHIVLDRTPDGELRVELLDFGVCASATATREERQAEAGRVYGTPSYVSPEQAAGDPNVDARADVFSLGVSMFECLSGRLPFHGGTISALLRRIIKEDAPRASSAAPHVDRGLDAVIARALSRDREARFPTARAFGHALGIVGRDRWESERQLALRLEPDRGSLDDASAAGETTVPGIAAA